MNPHVTIALPYPGADFVLVSDLPLLVVVSIWRCACNEEPVPEVVWRNGRFFERIQAQAPAGVLEYELDLSERDLRLFSKLKADVEARSCNPWRPGAPGELLVASAAELGLLTHWQKVCDGFLPLIDDEIRRGRLTVRDPMTKLPVSPTAEVFRSSAAVAVGDLNRWGAALGIRVEGTLDDDELDDMAWLALVLARSIDEAPCVADLSDTGHGGLKELGLSTNRISRLFAHYRTDRSEFSTHFKKVPGWLEQCRIADGRQGGAEAYWDPFKIASHVMTQMKREYARLRQTSPKRKALEGDMHQLNALMHLNMELAPWRADWIAHESRQPVSLVIAPSRTGDAKSGDPFAAMLANVAASPRRTRKSGTRRP